MSERMVGDIDCTILLYRLKYGRQMVATGWYFINQDTIFQRDFHQ